MAYDPAMLRGNAIAAVVVIMAAMGAMPLAVRLPGLAWPRSTLPLCALLYALCLASALPLLWQRLPEVLAADLAMDARMVSAELVVHLVPLLYVPVIWRNAATISRRTARYGETKRKIQTATGRRRDARRRKVFAALTVALVALAAAMGAAAFTLLTELRVRPVQLPALLFSVVIHTLIWWNVVILLLQVHDLAEAVLRRFQRVAEREASVAAVRAYRRLWAELRDELGHDDHAAHTVYVANMLYLLSQCTMMTFETVSFYAAGNTWACLGHAAFALVYLLEICLLCECAHRVVALLKRLSGNRFQMRGPFVAALDRLSSRRLDPDCYAEVCFFYKTIVAESPTYSVRGFACLDRPTLASIITTIVGYLIFLAQFQVEERPAGAASGGQRDGPA